MINKTMHIVRECLTPNGATAMVHRLHRVEIGDDITVTINSFASESATMTMWQEQHFMPSSDFVATTYPDCIYDWLVSPTGPFSGGQLLTDPTELESTQARLRTNISVMRDKMIALGCDTPSGRVDTDEISIRNIMGTYQSAVLSLVAQQPFAIDWRMADNTLAALDANAMIAIGNAVLERIKACYERSWVLKDEVDQATVDTIDSIVIGTGWPA